MLKPLPKERKFSGIEQVQMLTQTAEREKEIHRLQHDLNASNFALQDERSINKQLNKENERLDDEIVQHLSDKIKLRNEITKLRSALNFYADPKNYDRITLSLKTAKVLLDDGEFARYVLGVSNE
ncbi:MAG TPA: hypothetical protein VNQ57_11950 [Ureibacillus sp.]|nr:hypothetical protein [Ureibacillus sp.]